MTDTNTAPAKAAKTVAENMTSRRVFESVDAAVEYLNGCAEDFADWGDQTFAMVGVGDEGFDPAIYTDEMDVLVTKLTRAKTSKNESATVKAIVVAPIPAVRHMIPEGTPQAVADWMTKILHKELNHVAVRALREAEDVSTVLDQVPTTLNGYIESGRASAGIMETFNALYKQINAALSSKLPIWAKHRLIKSDLKRAMESKAYASEIYAGLEDYRGESLFVAAIKLGISAAKRKALDPAIFERWLATRDQKAFELETEDEDELDIDSLTDELLADDEPDADAADADAEA